MKPAGSEGEVDLPAGKPGARYYYLFEQMKINTGRKESIQVPTYQLQSLDV